METDPLKGKQPTMTLPFAVLYLSSNARSKISRQFVEGKIVCRNVHWNSHVARLFEIIFALQRDSVALQTVMFYLLGGRHTPTHPRNLRPCVLDILRYLKGTNKIFTWHSNVQQIDRGIHIVSKFDSIDYPSPFAQMFTYLDYLYKALYTRYTFCQPSIYLQYINCPCLGSFYNILQPQRENKSEIQFNLQGGQFSHYF